MKKQPFDLVPFPGAYIPETRITGYLSRQGNILAVQYFLSPKIDEVLIPTKNPRPARKAELWLATCFECFLAIPGQPQYWEFNLSPSGDWNVYAMDAYRRVGFREEELVQTPQLTIRNEDDGFRLDAVFDLSSILKPDTQLQAGVTSVIQTRHVHESYWALAHPQPAADFHLRESFIITL